LVLRWKEKGSTQIIAEADSTFWNGTEIFQNYFSAIVLRSQIFVEPGIRKIQKLSEFKKLKIRKSQNSAQSDFIEVGFCQGQIFANSGVHGPPTIAVTFLIVWYSK
jgi:hypothetical protein